MQHHPMHHRGSDHPSVGSVLIAGLLLGVLVATVLMSISFLVLS